MSRLPVGFVRCKRSCRCPVCGKPDWCLVSETGDAYCARIPTNEPPRGAFGWLHRAGTNSLVENMRVPTPARAEPPVPDWAGTMSKLWGKTNNRHYDDYAATLGITSVALACVGGAWMESKNAMAFPMYGEDFKICGIRLRDVDGKKWAVPSSREGIFRPYEEAALLEGPTVVCEGPTDTASLIQVGLHAIGAPSAGRGLNAVMAYCKARRAPVVIVGDADGEAGVDSVGVRGAKSLANGLTLARLDVRIVYPFKVKDAREWVKNGLTRREFFLTADAQNQWKVSA